MAKGRTGRKSGTTKDHEEGLKERQREKTGGRAARDEGREGRSGDLGDAMSSAVYAKTKKTDTEALQLHAVGK